MRMFTFVLHMKNVAVNLSPLSSGILTLVAPVVHGIQISYMQGSVHLYAKLQISFTVHPCIFFSVLWYTKHLLLVTSVSFDRSNTIIVNNSSPTMIASGRFICEIVIGHSAVFGCTQYHILFGRLEGKRPKTLLTHSFSTISGLLEKPRRNLSSKISARRRHRPPIKRSDALFTLTVNDNGPSAILLLRFLFS